MSHQYRFIKVFGERNSGTNFINELCEKNFVSVATLTHGNNEVPSARAQLFPKASRKIVLERLIDTERDKEFPQNFGWKHARVTPDYLQRSPRFDETLFVFVIKNPHAFLRSLARRPYNIVPQCDGDRSAFIRAPIIANVRDNLEDAFIATPIDLWNLKNASYLSTSRAITNAVLIRYEDALDDLERTVAAISQAGIARSGDLAIPLHSTKNDAKTFWDYRSEAMAYEASADFKPEDIAFIDTRLDHGLVEGLHKAAASGALQAGPGDPSMIMRHAPDPPSL